MLLKSLGIVLLLAVTAAPCRARTLVVTGRLSSEVTVTQQVTFGVDQNLPQLTYRFPLPAGVDAPSISQRLADHRLTFDPQPASVKDETDGFGNHYKVVTWRELTGDARATIVFTSATDAVLDPLAAKAPFPLTKVPEEARSYLKATKLVQSDDREIAVKAAELTAGAATEAAAVDAILNFVTDHIRYETPPKFYDALYGFSSRTGNCQNYAHLACALLRASGIPARVAVGLTLKEKWKIPLDNKGSSLVQGMGEGLHAWFEVFYPGLGWLPYDPQQSKQFTSTRHIKYAHGPECVDIGATWRAAPVLPRYDSVISSNFTRDVVDLSLKGSGAAPRGYMASNEMIAAAPEPVGIKPPPVPVPLPEPPKPAPKPSDITPAPAPDLPPVPPPVPTPVPPPLPTPVPVPVPTPVPPSPVKVDGKEKPKPEPEPSLPKPLPKAEERDAPKPVTPPPSPAGPPPVQPDKDGLVVFGNMRFPAMVSFYTTSGDRGEATLERETAEYVTSTGVYAQAFVLDRPLRLEKVSLAMKKFGGDGTVYLDIVADENGKPGLTSGVRSRPVYLENVRRLPGYGWLDFALPADTGTFEPGKYWIVLRRSGEAIMNWFYTPGKPYGGPDDTRSTARGWQWEDILTYDFVFKVAGRVVR